MKFLQSDDYLCFATLLEMILNDNRIYNFTRFDIAEELGVTLPLKAYGLVGKANYSDDAFEWGIKVDTKKINSFFHNNGIMLQANYIHATPYTMLEDEIRYWNQCNVIFLFSYGVLMGDAELQDVGHAALYVDMPAPQRVRIYDPGPKDSGVKIVDCYGLEEAMYLRRGGYVIIKNE